MPLVKIVRNVAGLSEGPGSVVDLPSSRAEGLLSRGIVEPLEPVSEGEGSEGDADPREVPVAARSDSGQPERV